MPLIAYPAGLPVPRRFPFGPPDRRAVSDLEGNTDARARSRARRWIARGVEWIYSPAEMAVWRTWYEDTLLTGQLQFEVLLPGEGGWLTRVARYVSVVPRKHIQLGIYTVTADLEIRGASDMPRLTNYILRDDFSGLAGTPIADHSPNVAPVGFAWADVLVNGNLILDGSGNARSENAFFDAAADAANSSPPLAIALPFPYSMEIRAHRGIEIPSGSEEASFTAIDPIGQFVTIAVYSDESNAYAIKCSRTGGSQNIYPVSGNTEHWGRVVVDAASVTVYADGVAQTAVPFTQAPQVLANVRVYAASETGATYRINQVILALEED
jgi:hypothetical protein